MSTTESDPPLSLAVLGFVGIAVVLAAIVSELFGSAALQSTSAETAHATGNPELWGVMLPVGFVVAALVVGGAWINSRGRGGP